MTYHVLTTRPGMHRGGRANPVHATYKQGDHSAKQMAELHADPNFTVVIGGEIMTAAHVEAMLAEAHREEAANIEAEKVEAALAQPAAAKAHGKKA